MEARNEKPQMAAAAMRRQDRALSRPEAEDILLQGEYGVLCTCGAEGEPYGVPLNYVYTGGCVCFHSATEGQKLRHLQQNAQACFTVVGATRVLPQQFSTLYESAIASGRVSIVAEGERKRAILRALVSKYCPEHQEAGETYLRRAEEQVCVCALQVEQLSGKAHR